MVGLLSEHSNNAQIIGCGHVDCCDGVVMLAQPLGLLQDKPKTYILCIGHNWVNVLVLLTTAVLVRGGFGLFTLVVYLRKETTFKNLLAETLSEVCYIIHENWVQLIVK